MDRGRKIEIEQTEQYKQKYKETSIKNERVALRESEQIARIERLYYIEKNETFLRTIWV